MNPLREWRRLRAVPDVKHEPSHSAGDERPSLALVIGKPLPGWTDNSVAFSLPADALDDAPPVVPVRVSARPGDPTPIFDAVLCADEWATMPGENPIASQFETAFVIAEFDEDELEEIRREAAESVSFGWLP